MSRWLSRIQTGQTPVSNQQTPVTPAQPSIIYQPEHHSQHKDPNAPNDRLQVTRKCVYERRLPGDAYITAHLCRLQSGYYDSPSIHEDLIENVRFVAINFVFHPSRTVNRFKSAHISIGLHDDTDQRFSAPAQHIPSIKQVDEQKPRFLRYAPHLLYGSVSPETLNWNFNLAGSLGVSQAPLSANIAPSGGVKSSYKLFEMMRIQGSVRTLRHWINHEYDVTDGELVWTMEENKLQKSGLPREFTFVMLITKGDIENVMLDIEIEPMVASHFGHFPGWWTNIVKFRPLHLDPIDLDTEIGQTFEPCTPGMGFNFADLAATFDDYVSLPGSTFSTSDKTPARSYHHASHNRHNKTSPAPQQHTSHPENLNVHVYLEGHRDSSTRSPAPSSERRKTRTIDINGPPRRHSLRHSTSRTDLRESMLSKVNGTPLAGESSLI